MINIDTRILEPEFGLNESEMWLLLHIVKRLNADASCFPSNARLLNETGWAMQKLKGVKKALREKGILVVTPRFTRKDRQTSNKYTINTTLMSVFVDTAKLTKGGVEEKREDEIHPPINGGKSTSPVGVENESREVLSREEVLTGDSSESLFGKDEMSGKQSPGKTAVKKKDKKVAHPAFQSCVDHWLKVVHPGWSFKPVDGKAMNSIIDRIQKRLEKREEFANGIAIPVEIIVNSFKHIMKKLPAWYLIQTLPVIDSKFDSVIDQIRDGGGKGNNWNSKASASRIIESL